MNSDDIVAVCIAALLITLIGGLLYTINANEKRSQENIIKLVQAGVPAHEASCAIKGK